MTPRIVLGLVCCLGTISGCAGTDATATTQTTSASVPRDETVALERRHREHGGVMRLIAVSLQEIPLRADQRQKLESLRADLLAKLQPVRDAGAELAAVLADGVASGTVDRAKASAGEAKLHEAVVEEREATKDVLDRLHDTLTPEQRAALIDKMQALWAGWHGEWAAATAGPAESDMAILTQRLGLSPEQVSRIQARFAAGMQGVAAEYDAPRALTAGAEVFGAAFRADAFDAKSAGDVPSSAGTFGATRMTRFFEAFAPELTETQRTALSRMILDHARRHDQP